MSEYTEWISRLNEIERKYKMSKVEKFLRYPLWTIKTSLVSRLIHNVLRDRAHIYSQVDLFFGERMYLTYPPNYDIKFYRALAVDPEIRMTKFLIKNLKSGDIFFDIGASQGYYTILASSLVGPTGKVVAFEPDPFNINILMKNKRENVIIVKKAVVDEAKELTFYSADLSTSSSIIRSKMGNLRFKEIKVEGISLDLFCSENDIIPSYIKVDVEGSEDKVLIGASKITENHNLVILMEIWFKPFEESYDRAIKILNEQGYKTFAIDDNGDLRKIDNLKFYFIELSEKYRKNRQDMVVLDNMVFVKI